MKSVLKQALSMLLVILISVIKVNAQEIKVSLNVDPNPNPQISEWVDRTELAMLTIVNTNEKLEGFEFKEKTVITSSEIVAYLKSILIENGLFTFGQDRQRQGKLISKIHRYLMSNLTTYQS